MLVYSCKPGEELIIERGGQYHKTVSKAGLGLTGLFDRVAAHINVQPVQFQVNVQFKTKDDIFAEMTATAALRIVDSKQYHYGAMDAMNQLGVVLNAAIRLETSALMVEEATDCTEAFERIVQQQAPRMRSDYGIDLVSLTQKNLNLPEGVKEAMAAAGITLRTLAEKAKDANDTVAAMNEGLHNDVQIKKPLVLKKTAP